MNIREIKKLLKDNKIKGYSKLKKPDLINLVKDKLNIDLSEKPKKPKKTKKQKSIIQQTIEDFKKDIKKSKKKSILLDKKFKKLTKKQYKTVKDLKQILKDNNIKFSSKLTKPELVKLVEQKLNRKIKQPEIIITDYKKPIDKTNPLSKLTVRQLDTLRLDYVPAYEKWSKLNKGAKIEALKEKIKDYTNIPEPLPRESKKSSYGVRSGKVVPYTEKQQQLFMNEYYDEPHPLRSKKLDAIKHKMAFEKGIHILLNDHQKNFIVNFINSYFQGGLLYHSVGSGKTLTAVAFSHYYLSIHPNNNVCIVSPPSLLFNFVDSLKLYGLDVKDNRYKFETFEKFIKRPPVNDKTLLIIDEIHIARARIIQKAGAMVEGEGKEAKLTQTKFFKKGRLAYKLIEACKKCHKVMLMTGTAFVNSLYDIENAMTMIGQRDYPLSLSSFDQIINNKEMTDDYFNYRISYFNVNDTELKHYFPKVNKFFIGFELNEKESEFYRLIRQKTYPYDDNGNIILNDDKIYKKYSDFSPNDIMIKNIIDGEKKEEDEDKEEEEEEEDGLKTAFFVLERQILNVIGNYKINFIIKKLKENPNMKSIVYSSFMRSSLLLLMRNLEKQNIKYVSITGLDSITKRTNNLYLYNDLNSGYNVLIISKAGTEGVDTKNSQQFFLFEPQFNEPTEEQAIARAVRLKSHFALPENQRFVNVYVLMTHTDDDKELMETIQEGGGEKKIEKSLEFSKKQTALYKDFKKLIRYNKEYNNKSNYYRNWIQDYRTKEKQRHKSARWGIGRKKPSYEAIKKLDSEVIELYYKDLMNKPEFKKDYGDKNNKLQTGINDLEISETKATSADLLLYLITINKKIIIDDFMQYFKSNIKQIEDFKEPFHNELIKAIDEEKDTKKLLERQRKILENNNDKIIKYSEKINELIINSGFQQMAESQLNKEESKLQEFFTPPEIADELIEYSINLQKIKDHIKVLEPTAGYGSLVSSILRYRRDDIYIDMCEINPDNRNALKEMVKLNPTQLRLFDYPDFLTSELPHKYDLIIMNPPFNLQPGQGVKKQTFDIDFVMKAYDYLNEGGEIVAIVSNNLSHGKKKYKKWIQNHVEELKKYEKYKWEGEKGGKLNLNFTIIRVMK